MGRLTERLKDLQRGWIMRAGLRTAATNDNDEQQSQFNQKGNDRNICCEVLHMVLPLHQYCQWANMSFPL